MKKLTSAALAAFMSGCVLLSSTTIEDKAALARSATTVATAVVVQTKAFNAEVKDASARIATTVKSELAKVTESGYEFYKNLYPIVETIIDERVADEKARLTARTLAVTVLNILDTIERKYKLENVDEIKIVADAVIDGFLNGINYKLTDDEKLEVSRCSAVRLGVPEPKGL